MRPDATFVGQPIRALQQMLRYLAESDGNYLTVVPDGIYGGETISAVSNFQRLHGLPVTGITDQATWDAIYDRYVPARIQVQEAEPLMLVLNPNQVIRKGERHPHIGVVQAVLALLSQVYNSISMPSLNGILDDATADSLSSFQYLNGMPMTGNLDKVTWKQLALQYPMAANLYTTRGGPEGRL